MKFQKNLLKIYLATLAVFLCFSVTSFASYEEALRVRKQIELTSVDPHASLPVVTKKLRTTRGFSQGGSQFCWVFGAINMLETDYLEKNPSALPEQVELSRWHFKKATGSEDTRGTIMDALYHYSPQIGLIAEKDYSTQTLSLTTFMGQPMTPLALRDLIFGDQVFRSYAFSDTVTGEHPHPDPDALPGTVSLFVPLNKKPEILDRAIQMGKAIGVTIGGHIVTVYGADYDSQGHAVKYYIKDNYPGYFYDAQPSQLYSRVFEMTSVSNLQ
jgi:hypothetical protein